MITRAVLLSVSLLMCASCANIETIERTTRLPTAGADHGLAIHLDAPQRLVFTDSNGNVCAEPTPDALQAYAASFGGGASIPSQGAFSFAQALQASSASIGLRTQSITLLRDALYRICEANHNGALTDAQVAQLLARSQDLTVAVLAIEQLTGAVVARQVGLGGQANAAATANLANTQANLETARKFEAKKKQQRDEAQAAKQVQDQKVVDAKSALDSNTDDTKKAALQTAYNDEVEKQKTTNEALISAQTQYDDAKKITQTTEDNLNAASATADAAASGTVTFAEPDSRGSLNDTSAQAIATAVQNIATVAINKGHLTDACIALMLKYADIVGQQERLAAENKTNATLQASAADMADRMRKTSDQCDKIIDADIGLAQDGKPPLAPRPLLQ